MIIKKNEIEIKIFKDVLLYEKIQKDLKDNFLNKNYTFNKRKLKKYNIDINYIKDYLKNNNISVEYMKEYNIENILYGKVIINK